MVSAEIAGFFFVIISIALTFLVYNMKRIDQSKVQATSQPQSQNTQATTSPQSPKRQNTQTPSSPQSPKRQNTQVPSSPHSPRRPRPKGWEYINKKKTNLYFPNNSCYSKMFRIFVIYILICISLYLLIMVFSWITGIDFDMNLPNADIKENP